MKETLLYVEITNLQKMCYRAVLERNRELLLRGAGSGAGGVASTFNNISMMLRHCCNHPWLIQEVEDGALHDLDDSYGQVRPRVRGLGLGPRVGVGLGVGSG